MVGVTPPPYWYVSYMLCTQTYGHYTSARPLEKNLTYFGEYASLQAKVK